MNPREKKLAYAVGGLLLLMAVWMGASRLGEAFTERNDRIERLDSQVAAKKRQVARGLRAQRDLNRYIERSLPAKSDRAGTLYWHWLDKLARDSGLEEGLVISTEGSVPLEKLGQRLRFSVRAAGSLSDITRFLYAFHAADTLHKVTSFAIGPEPKLRRLQLAMTVEVLSLHDADDDKPLPVARSEWSQQAALDDYRRVIETRNIFAPPNKPPTLKVVQQATGNVGKPIVFTASASDPDENDKVAFELGSQAPEGAKIDPESGEFTWTPQQVGSAQVTIIARDNANQSKTASQVVRLEVRPNSPPEIAETSTIEGTAGQLVEHRIRASDPDPQDELSFALGDDAPPGAEITGRGELRWKPEQAGKYAFMVVATDDGVPQRSARRKITVNVAPANPFALPTKKLDFDDAEHTYVVGIVENGPDSQLWLHVRTSKNDEIKKLGVGKDFEIGSVAGVVRDINQQFAVIEVGGLLALLQTKQKLTEAAWLPPHSLSRRLTQAALGGPPAVAHRAIEAALGRRPEQER